MRYAVITIRPTPEQQKLIDQAARLLDKTPSDFMLEAACDCARSVVLNQVLGTDKFQQFTAMLDEPAAPNAGLQRLMAVQASWSAAG